MSLNVFSSWLKRHRIFSLMSMWAKIVSWPLINHMLEAKQRLLSSCGSSYKNGVKSKREFPLGINTLLNHLSVREVRQKCTQNKLRHTQTHRTYLSCCVWVKQGWVTDWGSLCPCCESSDDHWSLHPHWGILVVVFLRHINKQTHPQKTRWWQNSWSHMWKEICRFVAVSWLKNTRKTRREIIDFFYIQRTLTEMKTNRATWPPSSPPSHFPSPY